nr:MAG TPA: hypothetical protein [Caudoviricetes sp.]
MVFYFLERKDEEIVFMCLEYLFSTGSHFCPKLNRDG